MVQKHPIAVAHGDGIGPEIMDATLRILQAAGAEIAPEPIEIGEKLYKKGHPAGIDEKAWEVIRRTKVLLKAPITTPQGGGYRSINVTIRTTLGLYANIRPCRAYFPFVHTLHPEMDLVIIRENEEDLYTGIEYQQTPDVCEAIKLISRPGSERIIRFAFEYASRYGHKKVTTFTKDNILKKTDGLFHSIFTEISAEYPQIESEHLIIDVGSAKLAHYPARFDIVVLENLYGDILSDITAELSGSIGLGGSANIGEHGAMFEAIHGSAPKLAGKNVANPSGLIMAAIQMLLHIHQPEVATKIHNAWQKTLEEGVHTHDIFREESSRKQVGTKEFADHVIANLGKMPEKLKPVDYTRISIEERPAHVGSRPVSVKRTLVGVDIFLYSHEPVERIQQALFELLTPSLRLTAIFNRGVQVWPERAPESFCIDHWRCRFLGNGHISSQGVAALIHRLSDAGLDVIKTENLYIFDGKEGY